MWSHLLRGDAFMAEDGSAVCLPMLGFLKRYLLSGEVPLWNPDILSGQTYAGHANSNIYYPPNYLVAFLEPHRYQVWTIYVHSLLGAAGVFTLAVRLGQTRRVAFFASCCFLLWPFTVCEFERYFIVQILGLSPWVLIALDKADRGDFRRTAAAGLLIGLQAVCGHHQHLIIQSLFILWLAAWRGTLRAAAVAVSALALGFLLAAPSILSVLDAIRESTRTLALPGYFQVYGTELRHLPMLFLPEIFNPAPSSKSMETYWFPVFLTILALAAPPGKLRNWAWVLAAAGLGLALANNTRFEPLVSALVPMYGSARYRLRYLFLTQLALLILACLGLRRLPARVAAGLAVLCLLDYGWYAVRFNPGFLYEKTPASAELAALSWPEFSRHATIPDVGRHYWNWGMIGGQRSITGVSALSQKNYEDVLSMADVGEPVSPENIDFSLRSTSLRPTLDPSAPILRMLCLRQVVSFREGAVRYGKIDNPMPRAFLCRSVHVEPDRARRLEWLARPQFEPWREVVTAEPLPVLGKPAGPDRVTVTADRANRLALDVENGGEGEALLVLSEVWNAGWSALLDGAPVKIWEVDHCLRGVLVPPGKHRLEMRYWPPRFSLGLACSAAALIGCLAIFVLGTFQRSRIS